MVQGQVFLKGREGGWHFSYLIFARFVIFTCKDDFTFCRIEFCI